MKTPVGILIAELQRFPLHAEVSAVPSGLLIVAPDIQGGEIPVNSSKSTTTRMGGFEGWMDNRYTTDEDRIRRWLLEHPVEARQIAFEAIEGLYLDEDGGALPEHCSYPRGSGSDYVDHVGDALERAKIMPLIKQLQGEVEEEDGDE